MIPSVKEIIFLFVIPVVFAILVGVVVLVVFAILRLTKRKDE